MKKFLKKGLVFGVLFVALGIVGFFIPPSQYVSNSLLFAQIDKDSLLQNTSGRRLILVGGSTLSLGINSQLLKDSLHLNPVNTGIVSAVGFKYMLDHTERFIRKGDVIVVTPDYDQYYGNGMYGKGALLITVMDVSKKDYKTLSLKQWRNIVPYVFEYAFSKYDIFAYSYNKKEPSVNIYKRNSFNKFGDHYAHWSQKPKNIKPLPPIGDDFNDDAIRELSKFKNKMEQKGATVYFTFQCIRTRSFKKNIESINHVQQKLKENRLQVLGAAARYQLDDSFLYDSADHLNKKGVDIRTKLLIEDIKRNIK